MQKRRHLRIITEMPPPYRDIKVAHHHKVGLIFVPTENVPGGVQPPLQSTYIHGIRYRNITLNLDDVIKGNSLFF